MSGNHTDILDCIIKNDLASLDVHISKNFIDPVSQAEETDEFPYITFNMSDFTMDTNSLRVIQKIDVFGFVKSAEDLDFKRSELLVNTATALKKRIKFDSGSMSNIFNPFGLQAFLAPPYGGFRLSGTIGFDLRQTPVFKINNRSVNWLMLSGAQVKFLDGSNAQFIDTPNVEKLQWVLLNEDQLEFLNGYNAQLLTQG